MRHSRAALATIAWLVAMGVGLAGCGGGSSTVSAGKYVSTICSTIGPYEKTIANRYKALNPSAIKNASQGKTVLSQFLSAIAGDTSSALTALRNAGTPNVTGGAKIQSTIVAAFTRLDTALKSIAAGAASLPTTSSQAFQTAATALSAKVGTSLKGIDASLSGLKSPALESAAKQQKACTSLGA